MPPHLTLLDARTSGLDEDGLRRRARALSRDSGAPFTSRSYRFPYALVAWHDEPIGVDIEQLVPCSGSLASVMCTPSEAARLADTADPDHELTDLWSSKEALAKALGDALAYEPSRLPAPALWPDGCSGRWRATAVRVPEGHVAWVCWRSP